MFTDDQKNQIRRMIQQEIAAYFTENLRTQLMRLLPDIFGRSLVQIKRYFVKNIR